MLLPQVFEVYLDDGDGVPTLEALTCFEHELITKLRSILKDRMLKSIQVRREGHLLLTLEA